MRKEVFDLLFHAVWFLAVGLAWHRAAEGWSSWPRFDWWFWCIGFWIQALMIAVDATVLFGMKK